MMEVARIAWTYVQITIVATFANIGSQALFLTLYGGPWAVSLSVLVGTAVGLPIKYLLEKSHVFCFQTDGLRHDARLFELYTFYGVFTTGLFWGTEYAFHAAFGTNAMRYLGAAVGLTLGYILRYQLDKRFVFVKAPDGDAA